MGRIRIWTAPQVPIGEMVADQLREAGLPVTTVPTGAGEMYPTPLLELWLEDEDLLEDEHNRKLVEDALAAHPLSEAEAETIDAMPFSDVVPPSPPPPGRRFRLGWLVPLMAVLIAAVAYLLWGWMSNWP